jgi:hypothetical protein
VSAAESIYCDDDATYNDHDDEKTTEMKSFKSKFNPHELVRKEQHL